MVRKGLSGEVAFKQVLNDTKEPLKNVRKEHPWQRE